MKNKAGKLSKGLGYKCKCGTTDPLDFYPYKKDYCKKCHRAEVKNKRWEIKKKAVEYKGGECEICGYDQCLDNLVFHHVDPNSKSDKLRMKRSKHVYSVTGFSRKWEKVKAEIDKCVMVCRNCHGEIEAGLVSVQGLSI